MTQPQGGKNRKLQTVAALSADAALENSGCGKDLLTSYECDRKDHPIAFQALLKRDLPFHRCCLWALSAVEM